MKEPEKILEAKDICKAYGKNMVLNQVNLTIKAGEIYGLVGENGAGKSSLMKVITGLTKPTSGEISLFGKKNLEDERNKIGCLIENPALYMDMTARQNLEIQRTQRGIPGKSSIDEVLEIMDLKDAGNKRVNKDQYQYEGNNGNSTVGTYSQDDCDYRIKLGKFQWWKIFSQNPAIRGSCNIQ